MSKPVKVAIAGLGNRGRETYAKSAELHPDKMEIVAVADIDSAFIKEIVILSIITGYNIATTSNAAIILKAIFCIDLFNPMKRL